MNRHDTLMSYGKLLNANNLFQKFKKLGEKLLHKDYIDIQLFKEQHRPFSLLLDCWVHFAFEERYYFENNQHCWLGGGFIHYSNEDVIDGFNQLLCFMDAGNYDDGLELFIENYKLKVKRPENNLMESYEEYFLNDDDDEPETKVIPPKKQRIRILSRIRVDDSDITYIIACLFLFYINEACWPEWMIIDFSNIDDLCEKSYKEQQETMQTCW